MWSLGMDGGAARRNWAIPVGDSAGEGVEKVEGLIIDRFVATEVWGNIGGWPAGGAQGAWPRRCSVRRRSGLGGGTVGAGRLGKPCGTARRYWIAAKWAKGGGARERAHGQDAGVQRSADRTGRGLYGSGRCSALRAGAAIGRGFNATVRRPPRPACTRDRLWTGGHLGAVRPGKCGLRSKDGRREGDHGPDLEAVGDEPHGRRGGHDCRSTARGADHTGRAPGAPAALWSAAELFFSRSTRL
jgi:hypothetical protein